MLKVSDIIIRVNSRLRDTRSTNWSELEIFDIVSSAYAEISRELQIYKSIKRYKLKGEEVYPLPKDLSDIISVNVDGERATIKSFDWVVNNLDKLPSSGYVVWLNYDGLRISPNPITNEDREYYMDISYNFTKRLSDENEILEIPDIAQNLLLFYSLYLANQKETDESSLDRTQYYYNLYKENLKNIKNTINDNKFSKNITSTYQRI